MTEFFNTILGSQSRKWIVVTIGFLFMATLGAMFQAHQQLRTIPQAKEIPTPIMNGEVSWYGIPFHGRKTANGETYNMNAMTAAHKYLPFNTIVLITNPITKKHVIVRINDRGPYVGDRVFDLSHKAAKLLGMDQQGLSKIEAKIYMPRNTREYRFAYNTNKKSLEKIHRSFL